MVQEKPIDKRLPHLLVLQHVPRQGDDQKPEDTRAVEYPPERPDTPPAQQVQDGDRAGNQYGNRTLGQKTQRRKRIKQKGILPVTTLQYLIQAKHSPHQEGIEQRIGQGSFANNGDM